MAHRTIIVRPPPMERHPHHHTLSHVAGTLARTRRLENKVRPVLDALVTATGLDASALTRVHEDQDLLEILWVHRANDYGITMPEGMRRPWHGALCQKALAADVRYTQVADQQWPECMRPRFHVRTYVGHPVHDNRGQLFGTLCAVSDQSLTVCADAREIMHTYAQLIGNEIDRERMEDLVTANFEQRCMGILAAGVDRVTDPHHMAAELRRVFAVEEQAAP